jgi:(R,R)-butanediol dehydrogenase/meso-butanediol dehydrogenase/diacetyl reductase
MRAWVYHGNKDLRLEQLPEPAPGPGEVAVRIAYVGICGTDLHEFFYGPMFTPIEQADPTTGHRGPVILGHEASGTVWAVGDGVTDLAVGQRVALEPIVRTEEDASYNLGAAFYGLQAPGFPADTATVRRSAVHPLPANVSLRDGALTEPLAVAWHAVDRAKVVASETVVVFGGGPIGIGTALSLRSLGLDRLAVVEPVADRRVVLEKLGLIALDPAAGDFRRDLSEFCGPGAEVVFDAAGVSDAVATGLEILAPAGRLVVVAGHVAPVTIDTNQLLVGERSILTSVAYHDDFPEVLRRQAAGDFPTDDWVESVPFEGCVDEGMARLAEGKAVKVLIEVGGQ